MGASDPKTPQPNADTVAARELRKKTLAAAEVVRAKERAAKAKATK